MGQRRHGLLLRGHKKTYPETRHPNWCDTSKPVFAGEWKEEAGYRAVGEKANGKTGVASVRVPETIVTVTSGGQPVAGQYVLLHPLDGQSTNPVGVLTDARGRAWFVLEEPGRYRVSCGAAETELEASMQPLKLEPGYDYIQWVRLGD